ncbi:hypothetical protein ACXU4B_09250 [Dyella soli]|uniref:Uncharacterized protein n=1 Tax=Dyella soli TaxID=522319 RepID=A0A4R0YZV3_9GAMM|nr:hypothetical protein [Dyella soli]TCI11124.1 hypothetical protein EZM97_20140 [Dyella soli]
MPTLGGQMANIRGWGTVGIIALIAACQRHAPSDVSPPASVQIASPLGRTYFDPADVRMAYGEQSGSILRNASVEFAIMVSNGSTETLLASGEHPVVISYLWLSPNGEANPGANETVIPANIEPGRDLLVKFNVVAPTAAGDYILKVVMKRKNANEFEQGGQAPLHYNVTVH